MRLLSSITDNSAICGGDVVDDGGDSVMARGICISLLPNPTLADRHTVDGSGMGTFTSQITGLSSNLSTTIGYWYYPMNDTAYEANYGLLYNWPAVMHGA